MIVKKKNKKTMICNININYFHIFMIRINSMTILMTIKNQDISMIVLEFKKCKKIKDKLDI
jgi:hypothetical protein